jgi:3-dehydroquinate dehydratase-2
MMRILVIHGPNLNLLGQREPEVYGSRTLEDLNNDILEHAERRSIAVETFQSNHEGEIIDRIQSAEEDGFAAIVINPGAFTHTSIAILDALRAVNTGAVEVHISNIHARGGRRSRSVTAGACRGIISGFGFDSYLLGIDAAMELSKS